MHVTAALAAGLLERRRAGQLLYALQQAANNLRFLEKAQKQAQAQANASAMGAPPFSPVSARGWARRNVWWRNIPNSRPSSDCLRDWT